MCIYLTNNKTERMAKSNKLRGYLDLPTNDGNKTIHFSMNFVAVLQDLVEGDLTEMLTKLPTLDSIAQSEMLSQITFAGLAAYALEEDLEVDYNLFKVRDWLYAVMQDDKKYLETLLETLTLSMNPVVGKKKPVKK